MEKKKRWLPWSAKRKDDQELEELRKKVSEKPDDPRLHQRLGELLLERGRKEEAIEALLKAGDCHAQAGFHLRAIAVYRRVLRMEESPTVMLKLAELYLANGFMGDALAQYKSLIQHYRERGRAGEILGFLRRMPELAQGNKEVRQRYIELLAQEGYAKEALDELTKLYLEATESGDVALRDMLTVRLQELGEMVKALMEKEGKDKEVANLQQRLHILLKEEIPQLPQRESQCQVLTREEQQQEEEIELLQEETEDMVPREGPRGASTRASGGIDERLEEARVYEEHGLFEEAEEIYRIILELTPGCAEALEGLKRVDAEKGKLAKPESASDLAKLEEIEKKQGAISKGETAPQDSDPGSHLDMGVAYMELGLLDEATEAFLAASKDPKTSFSAYKGLGECFKRKGELEEATKWFRKALSCKGVSTKALLEAAYELAVLLELQGRQKEALALYRKIYEINRGFRDTGERIKALSD